MAMDVRERILTIRLLERIKADPRLAEAFVEPQSSQDHGGE